MRGGGERAVERHVVYCVVPRELAAKLHESLRRHFGGDSAVEVVVERRVDERRRGARRGERRSPGAAERRVVHSEEGRRIGDRRGVTVPVAPPTLPRRLRRYADRLTFVECLEPEEQTLRDAESQRLVVRYQAGDASALNELYMRYFDEIYTYARVALREHQAAEDATQHVFERALGALERYEMRPGKPFRAWLFRIARNTVLDAVADQRRFLPEAPQLIDRRRDLDNGDDTAAVTLGWLEDRDVARLIERLPEAQQQVLVLRYMLDLSMQEIGVVLDRTPGAIRKLHSRALRLLEERLAALGHRSGERHRTPTLVRLRHPRVLVERRFSLLGSGPAPSAGSRARVRWG